MKKTFFLSTILFLLIQGVYAQLLTGTVKDDKTKQTIPFVNVGVVSKGIGTVTDSTGAFKINMDNNNADSLRVSMTGYYPQSFLVADLKKNTGSLNVQLVPRQIQLKEVKVSNHKYKEVVLGNTTQSESTNAGFTSNQLGNEIGAIIKIKKSPTYLKRFNTHLAVGANDSVKLRLNIYSVKDGLPYQNILQQNIFVTVRKGEKNIIIDLEPYFIMVEDKFFISLEWIQNSRGHGLMFSASLLSSAVISRETSQAKWEKEGIAGVGFNVLAEY